jgi:eukaryotic-like serine/threonine-protein kinase
MSAFLLTEGKLLFELREKVGSGGEGEVYKALDKQLNSIIAIKKVSIATFIHFDDYFEEARKLYLTRHHNIVPVNYACKDATHIYLAMPFYERGSVASLMENRFLTSREIIRYSLQFLSGLNNIHSKGLIHFDIKPENILLTDSNQALVSDFGLAKHMGHLGFANIEGTTEIFAPPEFFGQSAHDLKFDIYQAGLAMYRMCNGNITYFDQLRKAFQDKHGVSSDTTFYSNLNKGSFPDRNYFLPHIPKKLKKVIKGCLEVDPGKRYSSIVDILNALSAIDTANDWQYSTNNSNKEEWVNGKYQIINDFDVNINHIIAQKNGKKSKNFSKSVGYDKKFELLYDCLNTPW